MANAKFPYPPFGERGFSFSRKDFGGTTWTWKQLRDRWETDGDIDYATWTAKGGSSYQYDPFRDFNPIEINEGFKTGTGDEILNTNSTDGTQEQLDARLQNGSASNALQTLVREHIGVTVRINKSSSRGTLFVKGSENNFSTRNYSSREFQQGGLRFNIREGSNSSRESYRLFTTQYNQTINGVDEIKYQVEKETIRDGKLVSTDVYKSDGDIITLDFDLSNLNVPQNPPSTPKQTINVFLDSGDISDILTYSFGEESGKLFDGIYESQEGSIFSIDTNTTEWNFNYVLKKNGVTINESSSPRQTYTLLSNTDYVLQISATKGEIPNKPPSAVGKPSISVSSESVSYNLASSGISLSYSTSNSDRVVYSLGNTTRTLPPNGSITLTKSDFSKVGQYEMYLQPVSTLGGSGNVKKVIINVSNTKSLAGPDITHITYPENIIGEDFKGYDVDFKLSWASINTNWVDIWVGKISDSTKLVSKRDPQGQLTLNVRDVLTKAGNSLEESTDVVDFKLLFIPYNDEGDSRFAGKTEEITISFDKGNLRLRRGNVVRDIREAVSKQFDTSILKKEDSKYLTHLLHLGEGDNKLISTWGVDTETFSEYKVVDTATGREEKIKEVKTLVLKLYEPLGGEIQENQQVWLSKIQSIPLIEQVTVIDESVEECISLQPNFNEKFSDDVGLQIYDDLIASGSTTSTDLVNQFVSGSGFDLKKLDIQFLSGSTTKEGYEDEGYILLPTGDSTYYWENFVKYSSATERVDNFVYKVKLIEFYNDRISLVTNNNDYTSSVSLLKEKERLENQINQVKVGFDAFEEWLYVSSSESTFTYPKQDNTGSLIHSTSGSALEWYDGIYLSAQTYDYNNPQRLVNNLPKHVQEDEEGQEFVLFFDMLGQHFDILWLYTKALAESNKLEHKYQSGIKDEFVYQMLESLGWDADMGVQSQALWEYAYGNWNANGDSRDIDGTSKSVSSGKDNQNQIWRRILNNLPYLLKHKGTKRALHALMSCYGIPSSMLTVMEFGGPRDVTSSGTTKFTYDDRTASINISGSAVVTIPWKQYNGTSDYPNSFEIRITSEERQDQQIVSGSGWSLHLLKDTGSLAKVELKVLEGSTFVSQSTNTFPFYNDEYTTIVVNKSVVEGNDTFEIFAKEGFQERIRNESSASLTVSGTSGWKDGSEIKVGGSTLNGSVDEIRLWTTPLEDSVIENHTLLPDAINGNHNSASSEDLIFRNDFEYPKNRGIDFDIKNVAIIQTYTTSSIASGFESITEYPYNYTPYERTVTAQVPSSGFNVGNKIRFEEQYNLDGSDITEDGIGLSYRERSTQKSYDKSPIDSDRLGLFFSPIKEINMDILRSVGPINVDDFIGNPSDDYKDSYTDLTTFREYYFQRYNLNFNEYIQLVRYIDRSLFDQLESLVPARAKVAKGLLIEPHILERSKTKWNRPNGEENYHETIIDTSESTIVTTERNNFLALVSASEDTTVTTEQPFYDGYVSESNDDRVSTEILNYDGTYVSTDESNQEGFIERNEGATMGGFEFNIDAQITGSVSDAYVVNGAYQHVGGFGPNDLAVAGFGLFGSGSHSIRTRLDGNGNIVRDRVKVFKVKESYQDTERIQVGGYPTGSGQISYEVRNVTRYKDFVTILPWDSNDIVIGGDIVEVTPLNGHFSTHYKNVEDLTTGLENSYFNGAKQTQQTTLDGGPAWEIFTTNPNTLRVSDSGRGSGEPILEVD